MMASAQILPLRNVRVGNVGVELVTEKLLHQSDLTIISLCSIPYISPTFSMTLARFPGAGERPLGVTVYDLVTFNEHPLGLQVNAIVVGDHVIQWIVFLIFDPLSLTGSLVGLIGRQAGLGVGSAMDKVGYGSGLVQGDGVAEVPTVHGGGVGRRPITAGAEPGQALLKGNSLRDRERPMDGVQLWMSIDPAVVPDVRPGKGARVCSKVPFLLLLQSWNRVGFFLFEPELHEHCIVRPECCCRLGLRSDRNSHRLSTGNGSPLMPYLLCRAKRVGIGRMGQDGRMHSRAIIVRIEGNCLCCKMRGVYPGAVFFSNGDGQLTGRGVRASNRYPRRLVGIGGREESRFLPQSWKACESGEVVWGSWKELPSPFDVSWSRKCPPRRGLLLAMLIIIVGVGRRQCRWWSEPSP